MEEFDMNNESIIEKYSKKRIQKMSDRIWSLILIKRSRLDFYLDEINEIKDLMDD